MTAALAEYESWLHSTANRLTGPDLGDNAGGRDDLAQVGRIAMWRAFEWHDPAKGSLPAYLTLRAKGAMYNALRPRRKHTMHVRGAVDPAVLDSRTYEVNWDGIGIAAVHGAEFAQAVADLPPRQREFVDLKFNRGYSWGELTTHFGYEPSGLWAQAKAKLAVSLAHLEAA